MSLKSSGMVRASWVFNMKQLMIELDGYSDYARELVLSCPLAKICSNDETKE